MEIREMKRKGSCRGCNKYMVPGERSFHNNNYKGVSIFCLDCVKEIVDMYEKEEHIEIDSAIQDREFRAIIRSEEVGDQLIDILPSLYPGLNTISVTYQGKSIRIKVHKLKREGDKLVIST